MVHCKRQSWHALWNQFGQICRNQKKSLYKSAAVNQQCDRLRRSYKEIKFPCSMQCCALKPCHVNEPVLRIPPWWQGEHQGKIRQTVEVENAGGRAANTETWKVKMTAMLRHDSSLKHFSRMISSEWSLMDIAKSSIKEKVNEVCLKLQSQSHPHKRDNKSDLHRWLGFGLCTQLYILQCRSCLTQFGDAAIC